MADTLTLSPETADADSVVPDTAPASPVTDRIARAESESSTTSTTGRQAVKSKTPIRAVPALVHGTNAAGAAVGAAYAGAGPTGVTVLGVTGAVAAAAALYRKSRSGSASASRTGAAGGGSGASGGAGRRLTGSRGGGGLRSGAGRGGGSPGRGNRSSESGRLGGTRAASGRGGQRADRPGGKSSLAPGAGKAAKAAKAPLAGGSAKGVGSPKNAKSTGGKASKAGQTIKSAVNKLRRQSGTGAKGTTPARSTTTSGRLQRLRRAAARKMPYYLRCIGAGLATALVAVFTIPIGVLWGLLRTLWHKADPLHAWQFPVRLARRMWRSMYSRSRRRYDRAARADQLTLDVKDPRKDPPMSGALVGNTDVLNGRDSRFAHMMAGCYAGYTGYRPLGMTAVAAEYAGLPNGIRAAAASLRFLAINCDQKYPCSRRVIAKLLEAYEKLMNAGARADEMVKLFREVHAFDIQRLVDPRTNEWKWNVTPLTTNTPGQLFMPGRIEAGCVLAMTFYRTYEPAHMLGVGCEVAGMSLGLNDLKNAITMLYQRTRDAYPVDDQVTSELATIASMVGAASDDASIATKLFAADHAREISHNQHPRKGAAGEGMWNAPRG